MSLTTALPSPVRKKGLGRFSRWTPGGRDDARPSPLARYTSRGTRQNSPDRPGSTSFRKGRGLTKEGTGPVLQVDALEGRPKSLATYRQRYQSTKTNHFQEGSEEPCPISSPRRCLSPLTSTQGKVGFFEPKAPTGSVRSHFSSPGIPQAVFSGKERKMRRKNQDGPVHFGPGHPRLQHDAGAKHHGFRLLLLPPETSVRIRKTRRRWWRARKEHQ